MRILGTGAALPQTGLSAAALDLRLGKPLGWSFGATGVQHRYVAQTESQIDLAVTAARHALADAAIGAETLDLIVSACAIPYQTLPSTAPLIQQGLGIADGGVATFDVNTTCLSFLTAMEIVQALFATGRYRRALIVSAEIASRALPWTKQPEVAALFGDGAAAAVMEADGDSTGLRAVRFRSFPSAYAACEIGAGGTRFNFQNARAAFEAHSTFRMDGRELFRITAAHFAPFVADLLREAGVVASQIDLVVPHQASPKALAHMVRLCGFHPDQVVNIAAQFGNQIAASIPFGLDHARRAGRLPPGARLLMLGTSAGVSFGGVVMDV
jgi:3-oxoacyl-[acyl-carrier-protein] synthase III